MKQFIRIIFMLTIIAMVFTACDFNQAPDEEAKRKLSIVYTDWSESIALANLSAILLEEKMDYDIVLKLTDVESAYADVASGNADVFGDAWLPETQQLYYDKHAEKLEKISITFPDARTGFVVPEYSPLVSINDLQDYTGEIAGIDEGAGVMIKARKALKAYHSKATLLNLSEKEMTGRLEDAIKRRKDIVVTGWEPHWIFARFDVRFLEDPDQVFGAKEKIYTIGTKGLEEKHPVAVRFFERMQLSEKQLNELVYEVQVHNDPVKGAKAWIKKNEYVVNQWVKNLTPERKKIM
ncbi:MAG: glycine betaine ABC transporter substrate-binding protein [Bacteroidales bacterium]